MSQAAISFTTFKFEETDRVRIRGSIIASGREKTG